MGYSCTVRASLVNDAVRQLVGAKTSNAMPDGGFYEIGREQPDGAITGIVWRLLNDSEKQHWAHLSNINERVTKRGSFKISADGKIVRWPGLSKDFRAKAEQIGAKLYQEKYGNLA